MVAVVAAVAVFRADDRPPGGEVIGGPGGGPRLVAFDSCAEALNALRDNARRYAGTYGPQYGAKGGVEAQADGGRAAAPQAPAPAEQGTEHSTTNNHEKGVGEPDLVQTDGRRVVTVADGRLRVIDAATRAVTSTLELPGGPASELLLDGDRALVLSPAEMAVPAERGYLPPGMRSGARLTLVDLAGPARMLGSLSVDGQYVDARQVGGRARIVLRSAPRIPYGHPRGDEPRGSSIGDWLPRYELESGGNRSAGQLVDCARVSHPAKYTGTSMLTLLTIDLRGELGTGDPVSIVADGDTVYGTATSLYVAAQVSTEDAPRGRTELHQFDITQPGPPKHVASGAVEGSLLNQYSLSEYQGHLRVATTMDTESAVTVLARRGEALSVTGKVGGLGKDERIYAVRFLGPVGYVVTFRQTDPLYTLDLADPAHPRAVGELKITGYSAYLHDAGERKLIGVGREADERGRSLGLQVSLFDVGDAARPRRIAQHQLPGGSSEVESDPHAFLYWPPTGLLVVPVTGSAGGALVLRLSGGTFTEAGTVRHPGGSAQIRRAVVLGNELWTVSSSGVRVDEGGGLAQLAWVPFT
ncbi:beta-propeller domain-containing protein [Amycolatopsis anabasis]|uniref:beta-propeller domain-containing protein n=1 Tax=Amycolatopsis anabasis TaxID=1840409 RepID=UPI001C5540C0|nr:beta-propeller domain-containing protein [Amycolatopsis anabasis]